MKKFICFGLIFGWSILFPSLSFNNFTSDIVNNKFKYSNLFDTNSKKTILETAEYDIWIKTIVLSSHK